MPLPPAGPTRLTRRSALTGAVLAGSLTACTAGCTAGSGRSPDNQPTASPDPEERLVADARTAEERLVVLLDATRAAHPRLAPRLAAALAVHQAHLDLLDGPAPTPALSAAPSSDAGAAPVAAPRVTEALRALVSAEQTLVRAHQRAALATPNGSLARLLSGLAAAAAQQAVALAPGAPR